jgi:hypothetical protein
VERGRIYFGKWLRLLRYWSRYAPEAVQDGSERGANPLTLGTTPSALAADLRKQRGRLTAADMLACAIAQAMFASEVENKIPAL